MVDRYRFLTAYAGILESKAADGWYKADIIVFIWIHIYEIWNHTYTLDDKVSQINT